MIIVGKIASLEEGCGFNTSTNEPIEKGRLQKVIFSRDAENMTIDPGVQRCSGQLMLSSSWASRTPALVNCRAAYTRLASK
jgi:hypothetical protein